MEKLINSKVICLLFLRNIVYLTHVIGYYLVLGVLKTKSMKYILNMNVTFLFN